MHIIDLLICPKCKCELTLELICNNCSTSYNKEYGVYDMISKKLSSNQTILWNITDEDILKDDISLNEENNSNPNWIQDYYSKMSIETKIAQQKQSDYMKNLFSNLSGVVCDLATGLGSNLQRLLDCKNNLFKIVCIDISRNVLAITRKNKKTDDTRVYYVATDCRYMSIKDNSFDYITSIAAFGNIPQSNKVAKELYRVLKPTGKLIIEGTYIDKNSESYKLAKNKKLEKGLVKEYLLDELKKTGFINIESIIIDKAIWNENPYDLLPVAGDMQYFYIITAEK